MGNTLSARDLLDAARRRITRFSPEEALAAQASGTLMVDLRCDADRVDEGEIPGAIPVALSVLPWRVDPTSASRDDRITNSDLILVCNDGFSSSLAAAELASMGIEAGDVTGGFRAWAAAGLPIEPHT